MLKRIFEAKNIPVWVDLWGHDVKHDWDWWYKQAVYYMPYILVTKALPWESWRVSA